MRLRTRFKGRIMLLAAGSRGIHGLTTAIILKLPKLNLLIIISTLTNVTMIGCFKILENV